MYEHRPKACRDFSCLWLTDETMSDDFRPDRVGLYPSGNLGDECIKIIVDPEHVDNWKTERGKDVVDHFLDKGFHLLVVTDKQINFLRGKGREQPEKIILDWLL